MLFILMFSIILCFPWIILQTFFQAKFRRSNLNRQMRNYRFYLFTTFQLNFFSHHSCSLSALLILTDQMRHLERGRPAMDLE